MFKAAIAITVLLAVGVTAHPKQNPWMRVPGGSLIHKDCIYSVPSGFEIKDFAPCPYIAQVTMPEDQIYAMDVHYTPATELMSSMTTNWKAPALPINQTDGQIVYFWPGFKSTQPTMGLPVLQPVLQYGQDCCGGGNYWCVRSWFVYGNMGIAFQSAETPVSPGDALTSTMAYDTTKEMWTINAINTNTQQNTTLFISNADVLNTEFHVAMVVLEVIMDESACDDLPASNSITFTDITVNGKVVKWTDRVQSNYCGEKITDNSKTVTFNWKS